MEFKSPFSRIEAILQNILGADNVLEDPLSRAEVILLAILNDTEITEELNYDEMSELEALLYAIKESDEEYDAVPQTRSGKILLRILHGEKYEGTTESRVEELLKEWSHAAAWYVKTVGPSNPISVTDALAEPAVGFKIDLSPIQASTPWIDTVADMTPYLLRPTETSGNTADEKLVGGSVVWNQLINISPSSSSKTENNVTFTDNRDGTYSFSTTAEGASADTFLALGSIKAYANHIYYFCGSADGGSSTTYYSYCSGLAGSSKIYNAYGRILKQILELTVYPVLIFVKSGIIQTTPKTFCPQLFDLTQMFANNPAIADYVYSLEQASAGSGIAWLKSYGFFTKDYYPYNPGEIMSMKAYSKRVVGFNLWDGTGTDGVGVNTNTGNTYADSNLFTTGYVKMPPDTSYYANPIVWKTWVCLYDENKTYLGYRNVISGIFTTGSKTRFVRISGLLAKKSDGCINLSDPNRNGEYEPYKEQEYELGNDELRGLFKLDTTTNKLYTDGDIKTSDGTITRIITNKTFTGSETWSFYEDNSFWYTVMSQSTFLNGRSVLISNGVSGRIASNNVLRVYLADNPNITISTDMNTLFPNGTIMICKSATPTTETSTPFTNPQDVYAGGTEEFVDEREVPIPAGHETIYSNVQEIIGYDSVTITHGTDESDPNPTEYTISFQSQGAVYSGSLDVLSGRLTIDMAEVDLGTRIWQKHSTDEGVFYANIADMNNDLTNLFCIICSKYPTVLRSNQADKTIAKSITSGFNTRVYTKDTDYSTASAFKSAMNGVQLVYELATPLTYNLTPVEIEMLLNENFLKSDGGVMTLTYKGTNPAILLMSKLRTNALMRKTKEIQNGNLQPILPNTKL